MKKIIFISLLLLLISKEIFAQSFDAKVNRNTIPEGETFVLTLELKDVDTTASPDLNLLNDDFMVLSVSNSYRTNIINSQVSKSRQWNLVMIPKKTGSITISEIELAGYKTKPITIKVTSAGEEDIIKPENINSSKFKITGDINNNNPYVQEQINYRLKIYDSGGLQGNSPTFIADNNDDWIIRSLGEPEIETKILNGKNLREITFNYALFPQKSGELTVPPVQFNGFYLTKNTRSDPFARFFEEDDFFAGFGMNTVFANKNPVVLNTKPIKVNVKPAVSGVKWWLPAKDIKLSAEFEDSKMSFKVGEPISRTIYMKAVGVLDTNLPDIDFSSVNGLKQYPEKPITEMSVNNNNIVSLSKISNVYIPSKSGDITLPQIDVKWFNTQTNSFEVASIPEYKIKVGGEPLSVEKEDIKDEVKVDITEKTANTPVVITNVDNTKIIYLLVVTFFGGILVALLLTKMLAAIALKPNRKKTIINAAKSKDLKLLRDELISWGQHYFPDRHVSNLQDVADIFDSPIFNRELDKIRETLYAQTEKDWDEKVFLDVFCNVCKSVKKHTKKQNSPLPKLYK